MKRSVLLLTFFTFIYSLKGIAVTDLYKQLLDRQKKSVLYLSTSLFSGYGTIKYLTLLTLIKDFEFLKAKKGGYFHTLSKTVAKKFLQHYPGVQNIIKTITSFPSLFPKVSLSTIGRLYFGKKALFGISGLLFSIRKLQKLKKELN